MGTKITVFQVLFAGWLALLVASATVAEGLDRSPVDDLLKNPIEATVHTFEPDDGADKRVWEAWEQSAYRWSLTLLSEDVATDRAQSSWQEVRQKPDPYGAYGARMHEWAQDERENLHGVLLRLQDMELEYQTRSEFEKLLFVAHYAAFAESTLIGAQGTLDTAAGDPERYYESSVGRRTVAYPLAQASVFVHAAAQVLDQFSPVPESPQMHIDSLQHFLGEYGIDQRGWMFTTHGTAHTLVRLLVSFELNAASDSEINGNMTTSLERLVEKIGPLQSNGFSASRAKAAIFDVSWWSDRDNGDDQGPMRSEMEARLLAAVEASRHEADILVSSMAMDEQGISQQDPEQRGWWPFGAVLPVVVALALLAFVAIVATTKLTSRRRPTDSRKSSSREKKRSGPGGTLLGLLLVGLLVTSGFVISGSTEGAPSSIDPVPEPMAVTPNERSSWHIAVLADRDDHIHFAWSECLDPPGGGCDDGRMVMKYRMYDVDTASWGDATTIVEPPEGQDAYLPVLEETDQGVVLVWLQGIAVTSRSSPPTHHPAEVWACIIQDGSCNKSDRLSGPAAGVESSAAAVGPDGALRVVWAESRNNEGQVVFRQQAASGWSSPVEFDNGGIDQRQPDVAVSQDGTAHVIWVAHPIPNEPIYRVVFHATVNTDTKNPSGSDYASQHLLTNNGAAVEAEGEVLHLVYGTERGLFHRSLIDGGWTDAYNVAQSQRNTLRPDLVVNQEGVAVVWMESVPPHPPYRLRMAEHVDGMWLRPEMVLDPPHRALSMPKLDSDLLDRYHLVWPGRATNDEPTRPHYMTLSSTFDEASDPPVIGAVSPKDESWNRSEAIELEAHVNLSSPLDRGETEWLLNGDFLDYEASGSTLSAVVRDLPKGKHEVALVVVDRAGNSDQKQWTFHIDRTQPQFTARVINENGDDAEGWMLNPVRVEGEILSDEGAPAWVEVQATHPEDGSIARLGEDDNRWIVVPLDGEVLLPEGLMLDVTVRARDEAGNINFGETVQVGWDSSAPELDFVVPAWSTSPDVDIPVETGNRSAGAPIDVHAQLVHMEPDVALADATIRIKPSRSAPVNFEGVADGHYELRIIDIRNVMGVSQDPLPGPWMIGVDSVAPEVAVKETEHGFVIEAHDETSGITYLRAFQRGDIIDEATDENGVLTTSIIVPSDALAERVLIQVEDVAGNGKRLVLKGDGSLEVEEDLVVENGTRDGDNGIVPNIGQSDTSGNDNGMREGQSIPGPVPLAFVLIVWLLRKKQYHA